jgi:inositol-hexakisphosphate 5-kinase
MSSLSSKPDEPGQPFVVGANRTTHPQGVHVDVDVDVGSNAVATVAGATGYIHPVSPGPASGLQSVPNVPRPSPAPTDVPAVSALPGTPEQYVSSTSNLPSPAVEQGSNKKSRPSVVSNRSNGPSLLTQALASARGIPPGHSSRPEQKSTQTEPPHTSGSQARAAQAVVEGAQDGGSMTPMGHLIYGGPVAGVLSASPTDIVHYPLEMPVFPEDYEVFNSHRELFATSRFRPRSLERTEKEIRTQLVDANGGYSKNVGDTALSHVLNGKALGSTPPSDPRVQYRSWRTDRTLSMGPEKAWSIGDGDQPGAQPGQVEMSITEALAGMEPTRSRKASHSLRLFKEALPDEHSKRKDPKGVGQHREKLATLEEQQDVHQEGLPLDSTPDMHSTQDVTGSPRQLSKPYIQPWTSSTVESPSNGDNDHDYFGQHRRSREPTESKQTTCTLDQIDIDSELHDQRHGDMAVDTSRDTFPSVSKRPVRSTDTGGPAEEAEDSGEEKVSSAVFVPHHGLDENTGMIRPTPAEIGRPQPIHRTSTSEHPSSWLVKADEPEVEGDSAVQVINELVQDPHVLQHAKITTNQVQDDLAIEAGAISPEQHRDLSTMVSRPTSQIYDDYYVHDHQFAPRKPLEAIELIPYKHQVGGHTTMWRFSKRAVCKQLNNSENKFYENIERFHRDLLPFLPRSELRPCHNVSLWC